MKQIKYILPAVFVALLAPAFTACDDMLDMGNDDVLYADKNHLTTANDTVNSYVGILVQLQKIAVRTNLFGELRGDLVDVRSCADANLKAIANFEVDDNNPYNNPRDYYSVINNCNYFLAKADTSLVESRYENNARTDFYVFRAEYVAVRAVRAWLYLQLGQIYGENIPLITEPILSLDDAEQALKNGQGKSLAELCDFFIEDLKPYVAWFDYFYHSNGYNSHMPARMSVFPVQLVLGDLYLWAASIKQDPQLAREAAKCYYDYIDWTPGGKNSNTGYKLKNIVKSYAAAWSESALSSGSFNATPYGYNSSWYSTSQWGDKYSEVITAIGMDSASAEGHFNELRYLYCYNRDESNVEASFEPSQPCKDYSDNQVYYDYYTNGGIINYTTVGSSQLTEEQVQGHYVGDLRLGTGFSLEKGPDMMYQLITKAYYPQDVIIYRTGDVYLRMAEALNYAGFPKFAYAILAIGLDNNVINGLVLPECTTTADSLFVQYFDFNVNFYKTCATGYSQKGIVLQYNTSDASINQIGLHQRGSGWAFENPYYYPVDTDTPSDSIGYPEQPLQYNDSYESSTRADELLANVLSANQDLAGAMASGDDAITAPDLDDYPNNTQKMEAVEEYIAALQSYSNHLQSLFQEAAAEWYRDYGVPQVKSRQTAVVDSLLDVESALETCFEGFRFGYLMRDAKRKGDPAVLAKRVAKRDPALLGILSDESKWYLRWNGQIGR